MPPTEIASSVQIIAADLAKKLAAIEREISLAKGLADPYSLLSATLDDCLASLAALNIWGPENRLHSSEIWNAAGHWLSRGWLQNQARTKPRGYAGDHEMLARIYENSLCDDPLGRLFDRYFQAQAAPQAVRNRMRMMSQWIEQTLHQPSPIRVAIVGSAFGLEVRDALVSMNAEARQSLTITLLDLDPAALEFARQQLDSLLKPEQLVLQPANLFRLPDRSSLATTLSDSNLILCPGLFDYLDDDGALKMIRCLLSHLASGGRLVIFQFAPHNPTRAYMEWFGNWYLTYRDREAFQRLFVAATTENASLEFDAEPLGIDLYAKVTREN
jgi:extracellular factor (EF) 3-hydroxypalmitic acid methyl ester biosynthesis protein